MVFLCHLFQYLKKWSNTYKYIKSSLLLYAITIFRPSNKAGEHFKIIQTIVSLSRARTWQSMCYCKNYSDLLS